jgi:hypothetical protein
VVRYGIREGLFHGTSRNQAKPERNERRFAGND